MAFGAPVTATGGGANSGTSGSIDTTGKGTLVVVVTYGGGTNTVTDSKSNTWTALTETGSSPKSRIYVCVGGTVGTGHTVTVANTGNFPGFVFLAFSGTGRTDTIVQNFGEQASVAVARIGSTTLTPPAANCLVVAAGSPTLAVTSYTPRSGWTAGAFIDQVPATNYGVGAVYQIQTTLTAISSGTNVADMGATAGVMENSFAIQESSADVTAPTLTSPTSAATGKDAGSGTVTTDEANGTLYSVVTLTSTPPSAAQVKLGQNASGASLASGLKPTQAITTTGAKTVAYTGLTTATAYFPYFMHEDSSANQSTVSAGASFTPSTLAYSGTIAAQSGVQGAAFVFSGSNPSTLFSGGIGTKSYTGTGLSGSGLSVNSSTGVLSGTCGTPGSYTVAIVGTDQSTAGSEIPQTETSNSFTLTITASGDTTRPTLGGVVTISSVTSSGATATWSAASDNSGTIAGYDYRINGGSFISLGNVLTVTLSGLPASTAHTIDVRARDPSGNVSTPVITGGFTTNSGTPGTFVSGVLKRNNGVLVPSSTITWMTFVVSTTGAFVVTKTGLSTNGAGVFSTTDAALTTGTYSVLWREATGQYGWGVASVA